MSLHNLLCRDGGMSENLGEEGGYLAPIALQCSKEFELIYKIGEAPHLPNFRRLCSYADVKLCKISLKIIKDLSYLCNLPWRKYVIH